MSWRPNDQQFLDPINLAGIPKGFKSRPVYPTAHPASNSPPNKVQEGDELSNKRADKIRVEQIRRDTDTIKNPSIGLHDIDKVILDYIKDVIKPQVYEDGKVIPVPVMYGNPEKWSASSKDGYLRDAQGTLIIPMMIIKRSSVSRNDNQLTLNRYLSYTWVRKHSIKNEYDKFSVLNSANNTNPIRPVSEIYNITLPDSVVVRYECTLWTEYTAQMNTLVELFNFSVEDYWGDKYNLRFRVRISEHVHTTEVQTDQDRLIRTQFTLEVYSYLLPETFEDKRSTTLKQLTPRKIAFGTETSLVPLKPIIQNVKDKSISLNIQEFLSNKTTEIGYLITSDNGENQSSIYVNAILTPTPTNLVSSITDIMKFAVFVNGILVPQSSIISFSQNGALFVINIDNILSEHTIISSDAITVQGKFQ